MRTETSLPGHPVSPEDITPPSDSHVQSLARGLAVIRSFHAGARTQTISEVSAATGLTRAGARRILLTLQGLGYVEIAGRDFSLTAKVLDLGFAYLTSMPLWDLAEPVLEDFVGAMQESCSAAVLDGTDIVYVLRVPTHKIITINLAVGSRLPAYCTSMGRVLLAALKPDALAHTLAHSTLHKNNPATITDADELHARIDTVRQQGWALVDQELEAGLISLAVPILGRNGQTIAAINVSGNRNRTGPDEMVNRFLPRLTQAAREIGMRLQRIKT